MMPNQATGLSAFRQDATQWLAARESPGDGSQAEVSACQRVRYFRPTLKPMLLASRWLRPHQATKPENARHAARSPV